MSIAFFQIHVYQARNLPAADASGSIDPYVVVKFMGHEAKTTVKKQTKNPSWYVSAHALVTNVDA